MTPITSWSSATGTGSGTRDKDPRPRPDAYFRFHRADRMGYVCQVACASEGFDRRDGLAGGLGAQVEHRPLEPVGLSLDGRGVACRSGSPDLRQEFHAVAEEETLPFPGKAPHRRPAAPACVKVEGRGIRNVGLGIGDGDLRLGTWVLNLRFEI